VWGLGWWAEVLGTIMPLLALLAVGRCVGRWAEILGVVSGECRLPVEMAGWGAYLPQAVGFSHIPNNNDSTIVIVFAILYSGDV
jgi:hypothetical protein